MPHTLPGSHRTRGFRSRSRPGLSRPTREPGSRRGRPSTASFRCPTAVSAPALRMLRAGALPPKKRSLEPNPLEKGVLLLQSVAGHGSCGWRGLSRFYGKMVRGPGGRTACFCPSTEGLQIRSGMAPKGQILGGAEPVSEEAPSALSLPQRGFQEEPTGRGEDGRGTGSTAGRSLNVPQAPGDQRANPGSPRTPQADVAVSPAGAHAVLKLAVLGERGRRLQGSPLSVSRCPHSARTDASKTPAPRTPASRPNWRR